MQEHVLDTETLSLEWRLQKGGLDSSTTVLERHQTDMRLQFGLSPLSVFKPEGAIDIVYYLDDEGNLHQNNLLVYSAPEVGMTQRGWGKDADRVEYELRDTVLRIDPDLQALGRGLQLGVSTYVGLASLGTMVEKNLDSFVHPAPLFLGLSGFLLHYMLLKNSVANRLWKEHKEKRH